MRLLPLLLLLLSAATAATGCGGCGSGGGVNDGLPPSPGSACPERPCLFGEVCVDNACQVVTFDCEPACGPGQVCAQGSCVADSGQCAEAGATCQENLATRQGFTCVNWGDGALCSQACDAEGACPSGQSCYLLSSSVDPPCGAEDACPEGRVCQPIPSGGTACRLTACRPSQCEGLLAGQDTCEASSGPGSKCYELPDGANFCFSAGQKAEGESCIAELAAVVQMSFAETCAPGLGCLDGVCKRACSGDEDCVGAQGGDACILEGRDLLGAGLGFCGQSCEPFTTGGCGANQSCRPVVAGEGFCQPAGTGAPFSACDPDGADCGDGTLCVVFQAEDTLMGQSAEGRCMPLCDLSAGAADDAGRVSEAAQAMRDATCPQPEVEAKVYLRIAHLAPGTAALDLYLDAEETPLTTALSFGQVAGAAGAADAGGWLELERGAHRLVVLPTGAPRTDEPLASLTLELSANEARVVALGPTDPMVSSTRLEAVALAAPRLEDAAERRLRVSHLLPDAQGAIDVVAVAPGAAPDDPQAVLLAQGLVHGQVSAPVAVPLDAVDLYAFTAGELRTDATAALVRSAGVSLPAPGAVDTLHVRGTLDPDDVHAAGVSLLPYPALPEAQEAPLELTCLELSNPTFGFCAQRCQAEGGGGLLEGRCDGDAMGCNPRFAPERASWLSVCEPVGEAGEGEGCDPAQAAVCAEGLYCLAVGNTGRCVPYCSVDGGDGAACGMDQDCQPLDARQGPDPYDVGRCGWRCEPGDRYHDTSCPQDLQSCKPRSSLQEDLTGSGDAAPLVIEEPTFCSASGAAPAGSPCVPGDCMAGSECLYPRSVQGDLVSTLLSPYFGLVGEAPTCRIQCDPFDGDSTSQRCEPGETCLVNYPWSAEVGHCAPIVEERSPFESCDEPGLSCGVDSVCTFYQGRQACLRLCDYEGGVRRGNYEQSTCPAGMQCAPLVADVGYCEARED